MSTVVVCGAGVSGTAAAEVLLRRGDDVVVVDEAPARPSADALTALGARVVLGGAPVDVLDGADLVVTSPGWRPTAPLLATAAERGIEVVGEVELAWRLGSRETRWLAVTGTNGKTTTTEMLAAMTGAPAAGNIGAPLLAAVLADPAPPVLAVELSSFQLHWAPSVAPYAGAVLNLAPDHLDWHGSFEAYGAAKARVWQGEWSVGNGDDPAVRALLADAPGTHVVFTLGLPRDGELGLVDGSLVDRAFGAGALCGVTELGAPGPHNAANALAAAALALAAGTPPAAVVAALREYRPGAHRNAVVAEVDGVRWVDDSKATNPHAAAASLAGYDRVVWVAGGLNKGLAFDDLVVAARDRLVAVVLIGTCADELGDSLARHAPGVPVHRASDMQTAVETARRAARPGDTVLLAPAAASMDMFRDYADRGDAFAAAVRATTEGR